MSTDEVLKLSEPDKEQEAEEGNWITWEPYGFSNYPCAGTDDNTIWNPIDDRVFVGHNGQNGRQAAIASVIGHAPETSITESPRT